MFKIKLTGQGNLVLGSSTVEVLRTLKGDDGKSAYDLWLEAGNEGTVVDFLNSLIGKDGEDGVDGTDGKTAYQYAVEGGYPGDESQLSLDLAALKDLAEEMMEV